MAVMTAQPSDSKAANEAIIRAAQIQAKATKHQAQQSYRAAKWTAALALLGTIVTGMFQLAGQGDDQAPSDSPQVTFSVSTNPIDTAKAIDLYDQLQREGKITSEDADRLKADVIQDQVDDVAISQPTAPTG
jgi:hypothetical protein